MRIKDLMLNQFLDILEDEERQDVVAQLTDTSSYWYLWVSDVIPCNGSVFHHVFVRQAKFGGYEGYVYRGFDVVAPILETGLVLDAEEAARKWQEIVDNPHTALCFVVNREC
ncbi:hypothetical protein LF599_06815 [Pseudodesulfovibrio thermohalotolerans]|uniref:hypothetical protein n=1 Tax=Pseudodesulfovibrio thermohalotolerans TaxID=2880651 RepID=UPI0022BA0129|nr:hypothetical protein [Pseudodesulfovibrio thermohalotolerans]WFS63867.1 hypothetical protein LF599_06815 [Pseudodesulfovibrio thermohalotolerans]